MTCSVYRWPNTVVTVICRQLGLPAPGSLLPDGMFGDTAGPLWFGSATCNGNEAKLQDCQVTWGLFYTPNTPEKYSAVAMACGAPPGKLKGLRLTGALCLKQGEMAVGARATALPGCHQRSEIASSQRHSYKQRALGGVLSRSLGNGVLVYPPLGVVVWHVLPRSMVQKSC